MPVVTLEKVIEDVRQLSPEDREKLRIVLNGISVAESQAPKLLSKPRFTGYSPEKDRSKEREWLLQHREEYVGRWIALDGDRLLGHGDEVTPVMEKAREAGVGDALVCFIEPVSTLSGLPFTPRVIGTYEPEDRTKEHEWLRLHSGEFAGQWVALYGDRLLSHGFALKDVMEKVEETGVTNALVVRAEPYSSSPQLPIKPKIIATNLPIKDRSKENAWLARHRDQYAGQWIALDGDRLLGHGKRFKDAARAADDAGVPDALIFIVEGSQDLPFAGF